MATRIVRMGLAFSGALLALQFGCDQQQARKSPPGALPPPVPAEIPQLNSTTYFSHGHLLERQGSYDRAVEQYKKALEIQPDFVSARNRLGITYNKLGRHMEACQEFLRAIEVKPEAHLLNNLGFSFYLAEQYPEAKEALQRCVEMNPSFARARMNLAVVLGKLGDFDGAINELRLVGSEADAEYNIALLMTDAARYAEAAQHLEKALASRPDFDAARDQLRVVARLAAEQEAEQAARVAAAKVENSQAPAPQPQATPSQSSPQSASTARPSQPPPTASPPRSRGLVEVTTISSGRPATPTPSSPSSPSQSTTPTPAQPAAPAQQTAPTKQPAPAESQNTGASPEPNGADSDCLDDDEELEALGAGLDDGSDSGWPASDQDWSGSEDDGPSQAQRATQSQGATDPSSGNPVVAGTQSRSPSSSNGTVSTTGTPAGMGPGGPGAGSGSKAPAGTAQPGASGPQPAPATKQPATTKTPTPASDKPLVIVEDLPPMQPTKPKSGASDDSSKSKKDGSPN